MNQSARLVLGGTAVLAVALGALACQPLTKPGYPGEALAHYPGTVSSNLEVPPSSTTVSLVWDNWVETPGDLDGEAVLYLEDLSIVEGVEVDSATFPASFTLDLFQPPPDAALAGPSVVGARPGEPRFAVAQVMVLAPGATFTRDAPLGMPAGATGEPPYADARVLGQVRDFIVVYAEADIAAGTQAARLLRGPLTAGYHLMDRGRLFAGTADIFNEAAVGFCQDNCHDSCTGAPGSDCSDGEGHFLDEGTCDASCTLKVDPISEALAGLLDPDAPVDPEGATLHVELSDAFVPSAPVLSYSSNDDE